MDLRDRPCEYCGAAVALGYEYDAKSDEMDEVDWCTNLSCPSNWVLRGFHRISPDEYECLTCGVILVADTAAVIGHRRLHVDRPPTSAE